MAMASAKNHWAAVYQGQNVTAAESYAFRACYVNTLFIGHLSHQGADSDRYMYRIYGDSTDDHIFILAINAIPDEIPDTYKPTLEIWTWKGEPVYRGQLDISTNTLAVSDPHDAIFAYNYGESDRLYTYKISDLIP